MAAICDCNHDAKRLFDDLLRKSKYNKLIRPVGNSTDKLTVKLGLKFSQLIDVVSLSLFPGICDCDSRCVDCKHNLEINVLSIQVLQITSLMVSQQRFG